MIPFRQLLAADVYELLTDCKSSVTIELIDPTELDRVSAPTDVPPPLTIPLLPRYDDWVGELLSLEVTGVLFKTTTPLPTSSCSLLTDVLVDLKS